MKLLKQTRSNVVVLRFEGDLMGGPEAVKVHEEINQLLDNGLLRMVIDLSAVERMNSSGLGILINTLHTYKQNGGDLKLAGPNQLVKNLLNVTKLNAIFESYDTVDSAISSF